MGTGHWGGGCARRHDAGRQHRFGDGARTASRDQELAGAAVGMAGARTGDFMAANFINCARCEAPFALLPGESLPKGWILVDGEPVCADCANVAPAMEAMLRRVIQESPRAIAIGPGAAVGEDGRPIETPSRFRGCRIGHEIALGLVGIEIRAGAAPPPGRDERVRFLLHANELDLLIIELDTIRAELAASQTPGTAAREGGLNG